MAWFSYKAVSASGEVIEGELEAADRRAVVERLRREGHVPIRAEELRGSREGGGAVARRLRSQTGAAAGGGFWAVVVLRPRRLPS